MTLGFGLRSVLHGVGFGLVRVLARFTFGFGSILGKTWVLVQFVLAGFGLFPITIKRSR